MSKTIILTVALICTALVPVCSAGCSALLQCSTGSMNRVNAWMQENDIEIPTGRIQERLEQVLRAWRVQELPWLVLTDTKHAVRAEGFAVNELDDKLE